MIFRPWDSWKEIVVHKITKCRAGFFKIYQVVGVEPAL